MLPAWGSDFTLIPTLGPNGPGLDSLVTGETDVQLAPASHLSPDAEIIGSGIWGDLLLKETVAPGTTDGIDSVVVGRLTTIVDASRRAQLAEALTRHADDSTRLEEALTAMRRSGDERLTRGLR